MKQLRGRVPELLDEAGLSERSLIQKYLVPLLEARAQFTKKQLRDAHIILAALSLSHSALRTAFELHGSYAPRVSDNKAAVGNVNIIVDLAGPDWSKPPNNVPQLPPGDIHPQQQQQASGNGHKKDAVIEDDDPQPKD